MSTPVKNRKVFDGRYEILGIVGRGLKSVVYHARNIVDGGPEVALKVLLSDKDSSSTRDKLRKEALAMVSCHHRYVVRLDDFHSVGDLSYLSMEFAPESDLRKFLQKKGGKLSEAQTEKFLLQAGRALDYIHSVGIIHRDIKPDNILVISEDEIRIGDFGIALLPGDEQQPDEYRNAVGTMDYMAPEILEGRPCDARTDLYALGLTATEMITGKILFEKVPLANQLSAREDANIPLIALEDKRLSQSIKKLLAFEPNERFRNAKELITFLTSPLEITETPQEQPKVQEEQKTVESEVSAKEAAQEATPAAPVREIEITSEESRTPTLAKTPEAPKVAEPELLQPKHLPSEPINLAAQKKELSMQETQVISSTDARISDLAEPRRALIRGGGQNNFLSKAPTILLAIAALLLIVKIFSLLFVNQSSTPESINENITLSSDNDLRAASHEGVIDLALLPTGIYRGTLTNVHPALQNVPLYLISDLEHAQLIVVVGVEGWTPSVIATSGQDLRSLRLSSGGIVLELSRLLTNDGTRVSGTVKNLTLGGEGVVSFSLQGGATK